MDGNAGILAMNDFNAVLLYMSTDRLKFLLVHGCEGADANDRYDTNGGMTQS